MDSEKVRNVPGWEDAPVPVCFGGDVRALAFCCKYVHAMPPGYECRRDEKLAEIGLSVEKFIHIKEEFSQTEDRDWHSDHVCWGSLAYCCLRTSGCRLRDTALKEKYPGQDKDTVFEEYFSQKKILARRLLEAGEAEITIEEGSL